MFELERLHDLDLVVPQFEPLRTGIELWIRLVGVHPLRKEHREDAEALGREALGELACGSVAGLVPVVSEEHPLDSQCPKGLEVLGCKALDAVGGRDVSEAGRPESQRV